MGNAYVNEIQYVVHRPEQLIERCNDSVEQEAVRRSMGAQ